MLPQGDSHPSLMRPAAAAAIVELVLILSAVVLTCLLGSGTTSALIIASSFFSSSRGSMAHNRETCEKGMQDETSLEEKSQSRQDSLYYTADCQDPVNCGGRTA